MTRQPRSEGADRATSTAIATLDSHGVAEYEFHLDWALPAFDFPEDAIALHTGSIATLLAPGGAAVERIVTHADIVKASIEDLNWLYGERDLHDVAADWLSRGPALVVITQGATGAAAFTAAALAARPAPAVAVVDTVGAGDAFAAAMLDHLARAALLGGQRRTDLANLPVDRLTVMLDHAIGAASLACTWPGALPPNQFPSPNADRALAHCTHAG